MLLGYRTKATGLSWIADPRIQWNADGPHWHPAIQILFIRQNVAGLWLKYGASPAIIEANSRRKNKMLDATIC